MEVILLKDVKRLGEAGQVRRVADGYARNYLFPRGLAAPATAAAKKQAEQAIAVRARRDVDEKQAAVAQAAEIGDVEMLFTARASDAGKLYGSVSSADIAERLSEKVGAPVDRRRVMLEEPIKQVGTEKVEVKLHSDVTITVTVIVEAEEAD